MNLLTFNFFLLLLGFVSISGEPYGATMRFNQLALKTVPVHTKLIESWRNFILNKTLPSIKEDNYVINFQIISINMGTSSFDTSSPNSLAIMIEEEGFEFVADWMYYEGSEKYSGSTAVSVKGIYVKHQMLFDLSSDNDLILLPGLCKASIGEITSDISNSDPAIALLLQLFTSLVRDKAEEMICSLTSEEMQSYLHLMFPSNPIDAIRLRTIFPVFPNISLNVEQRSVPEVSKDAIIFYFDGAAYSTTNPERLVPIEVSPPPPMTSSRQMVQLVFGDYVFQTLNYARFQDGGFDEVDPIALVNEHFGTDISIESLAEKLPELAPYANTNSSLDFVITGRSPPTTHINTTGIYTTEERNLGVRVTLEDGREVTVLSVDYINEIRSQLYVLNDEIHLRMVEFNSTSFDTTRVAVVFNQFRERSNPNFVNFANEHLVTVPYMTPHYGPLIFEHITVRTLESGIEIAADLGFGTTQKSWQHMPMFM